MAEKNVLNNDDLQEVVSGSSAITPKLSIGEKVTFSLHPEFGVGTVSRVYLKDSIWICQVRFNAGYMDVDQDELAPA